MKNQKANRLINASSPYLLQHAYNPVEWFEWGAEALTKAKMEDKPILVSIGYSACHWCHVMERESFEKESVAEVMNRAYVCIKVDREERPDLDQIYMDAVQVLGVNGGWPLNVFLTPDQKPFFGGTYFSPPAWTQILTNIDRAFKANRQQIEDTSEELRLHLLRSDVERFIQKPTDSNLTHDLDAMTKKLSSLFDTVWGGLDKAPKFIMPSVWQFLLRHYYLTGNTETLDQIYLTLQRIAMGGIYDQVGGGFSRYSVDGYWFIPHFEKMLYDNAQLLSLYSEAYAVTKDEDFKTVVYETFAWLQREMTHTHGGFFSALDADSEGVEGKYYRWKKEELDAILGKDAAVVEDYYHVQDEGNWEDGYNILMREKSDAVFRQQHGLSEEAWKTIITNTKQRLLQARAPRVRPGLDDKIITAWNAMTITGLTDAYKTFDDEVFLNAAKRAMQFLENELMEGHTLYRSFKEKRSSVHAFLDDYAFVIQAYRKLYEVTFEEYYLLRAERFLKYAVEQFRDPADGFFFYTAHAAEALIARKKEIFDNVIPSSNAVMAQNLLHLGIMLDRSDWKEMAAGMTGSLAHLITTEPNYMSYWGIAYAEVKNEMAEIIIAGEHYQELRSALQQRYHPFSVTMGAPGHSGLPLLQGKVAVEGKTTLYVCYNKTCRLPVYSVEDAEKQVLLRRSPHGPNPAPALRHS